LQLRKITASTQRLLILILVLITSVNAYAEAVFIIQPTLKEPKYKAVVTPNTVITKPTCPAGWVASIFVTPVVASAYGTASSSNLNVIAVFDARAVDNGDGTWTVQLTVKDNQGNIYNNPGSDGSRLQVIAEAMCCPNGGSCQ
jgi:hypothetical protein